MKSSTVTHFPMTHRGAGLRIVKIWSLFAWEGPLLRAQNGHRWHSSGEAKPTWRAHLGERSGPQKESMKPLHLKASLESLP